MRVRRSRPIVSVPNDVWPSGGLLTLREVDDGPTWLGVGRDEVGEDGDEHDAATMTRPTTASGLERKRNQARLPAVARIMPLLSRAGCAD